MEILDLSIKTLMTACKGNVANLPSFMVHGNAGWPGGGVQLDKKNRIHLSEMTFLNTVCRDVPVREGIWHGVDTQEFHIDLKPHHLQGSDDMVAANDHKHSRDITLTDKAGRNPGHEDYGEDIPKHSGIEGSGLAQDRIEIGGKPRGVSSTICIGGDTEHE